MPNYMTVQVKYGTLPRCTYYRQQTIQHPSHDESAAFTNAAKMNYVTVNHLTPLQAADVEVTGYKSGQGVPTGGETFQI